MPRMVIRNGTSGLNHTRSAGVSPQPGTGFIDYHSFRTPSTVAIIQGLGRSAEEQVAMTHRDSRKEPGFSESGDQHDLDDELFESRLTPQDKLDPRLRLAAFAVLFIRLVLFIEWGIQKYHEYRANQALKEMMAGMERSIQASTAELRAMTERNRQEAERRRLALREKRASTNQGKWLAKNCSDWRRTYNDLKAATAEREMKRHCRLYEKYLDTGIANTPID